MRITKALAVVALMGALVGCSGAEPQASPTVTHTVTATVPGPTVTKEVPGPTVTITATPTGEATGSEAVELVEGDVTELFLAEYGRERWADDIIDVEREGDRLVVRTKIVDPRGRDGSPEAAAALDVCRAAQALMEAAGVDNPSVVVYEADDSTFIIKNDNFDPECLEV